MANPHGNYAHLLPPSWASVITGWLAEDTPSFDYGGFVVGEQEEDAVLLAKKPGVLAGVPFFDEIFKQLGCSVTWHYQEGDYIEPTSAKPKITVATVHGRARHLLLGESCIEHLGAVFRHSYAIPSAGGQGQSCQWKGIVAGTRKTTPGFRIVEKYGMLVGGVDAHRYDLSSMVMPKDNHIWSKGSIPKAVAAARSVCGFSLRIDVECTSQAEAIQAIEAGADVVMLDNFTKDELHECCKTLKEKYGGGKSATGDLGKRKWLIEVSGGVTPENFEEHVHPDVDIISTSSIHQSVQHIDFSLKITPKKKQVADDSEAL